MEQPIRFKLTLSSNEFLRYYQGSARQIIVTANDGRRITFPVEHLRAFVTHAGIDGEFELRFDHRQRFVSLQRLA